MFGKLIGLFGSSESDPEDCGDVYPYHSATPHWHVGYPTKKQQSFERPKRSDPFDGPDSPTFVNKNRIWAVDA